ncbi:MAG: NAD-dependent epimerase/dehydratase family protein [Candidatus Eremiobacteraeota bacterium]|nr:NAD-dependent epimerase/dehydratase family protein [Candidatus Eremiobacteraeota bacterium]
MRVCILGGDGYLGWPTAMHFSERGHQVLAVDSCVKRRLEAELSISPLEDVPDFEQRADRWNQLGGNEIKTIRGDIYLEKDLMNEICRQFKPDVIVHYAEQPSAPYSMLNREAAAYTQVNNVVGTLNVMFAMHDHAPRAHLIKLGTMGEYGTPNIDIEEGWITVNHKGRSDRMVYPKRPSSYYHCSKVHDSTNLEFACRSWGLRVTDLNQGVVYGIETSEMARDPQRLRTSFHYDDVFGTVLNRFVVQAVAGVPLTVYGAGGQTRGYLNIKDTLACVEIAALNPADSGEFRVFNQFTEQFSVSDLADRVSRVARRRNIAVETQHIDNPRVEAEKHYYNAVNTSLLDLGLEPHLLDDDVIDGMISRAIAAEDNIRLSSIMPRLNWARGATSAAQLLASRSSAEESTAVLS